MATPTCLPDRYLSQTHLDELFNDFDATLSSGQSSAAIFSSVVNNVRHVYMAALLGANEVMLAQFKEDAEELVRLKRERSEEGVSPPKYTTPVSDAETPVTSHVDRGTHDVNQAQEEEISWPAKTFTLHIGSYSADHRRDMADWESMNKNGWTERLDFKVFKYEEPGTIRIDVTENFESSHRVMVNADRWSGEGWKNRLTFYAYGQARPGTRMVWVAYRADPDRCIFLKGGRDDKLEGWERRLEFWVPK